MDAEIQSYLQASDSPEFTSVIFSSDVAKICCCSGQIWFICGKLWIGMTFIHHNLFGMIVVNYPVSHQVIAIPFQKIRL